MRVRHTLQTTLALVAGATFATAGLVYGIGQPSPAHAAKPPSATTKLLANLDLDAEIEGMAGRTLRTRLVTIPAGGKISEHSHTDRPSVMYLTEGRVVEHRRDFSKEYVAGDTFVVGRQVPHWSENPGNTPASYVEVDIFTQGPVPIVQEPRHRVVFESGTTRVHDVQVAPGDTTLYHIHDTPILYVPISRSQTRSQVLGAEWTGGDASQTSAAAAAAARPAPVDRAQRVSSITSYVEKPVTHRVNNVGDGLFRLIAVVNRAPGSDGDGEPIAGLPEKPEVLNRYYRAYRVTLGPNESAASHRHGTPVVVVQQTAGRVLVQGSAKAELSEPGKFAYHDGNGTHQVKNLGTAPVEVIEVELRGGQ